MSDEKKDTKQIVIQFIFDILGTVLVVILTNVHVRDRLKYEFDRYFGNHEARFPYYGVAREAEEILREESEKNDTDS